MSTKTLEGNFPYSKAESWKMFDQIAPRYDFLNRILSLGLDVIWRKKISMYLPKTQNMKLLDLATGTGDVLLMLCEKNKSITHAQGIDLSQEMLDIGKAKIAKRGLSEKISLQTGDINNIPLSNKTFDCATIAFGIRNVTRPENVLSEMFRVLKPGGRSLILEFSRPRNKILNAFHTAYLRTALPVFGALIAGNFRAYQYLNKTVEAFVYGEEFCALMRGVGFQNVTAHELTFGVATIYQGDKPF